MQHSRVSRGLQMAGVCAGLAGALASPARADTAIGCNLTFGAAYVDDGVTLDGLNDAAGVATYGTHIYVVSPIDNSIVAITRQGDNSLVFADFRKDNVFPVLTLDNATAVAVSGDGNYVYVAAGGSDKAVTGFSVSGTNTLTHIDAVADSAGLAGASGVAVSPDGKNVYATGATSDAVVILTRNTSTGSLSLYSRVTNSASLGLDGASAVAVSPDNKQVYVTGKLDNAINQFDRNLTTGALTFVEKQVQGANMADGLNAPTALVISPDGAFVYTAGSGDGKVGKYTRNTTTGELDFVRNEMTGNTGLTGLAISSDGTQFFAVSTTASTNGSLRQLNRNTTTGELSNDTYANDSLTTNTLMMRQPTGVAVTADGQHLYVTSKKDNAIDTFLVFTPNGTECEAGNTCTADTCDGAGSCVLGPCTSGGNCVTPSCAAGLCDNTGDVCSCKKID